MFYTFCLNLAREFLLGSLFSISGVCLLCFVHLCKIISFHLFERHKENMYIERSYVPCFSPQMAVSAAARG